MQTNEEFSVVVLAGGRGRRLGEINKAVMHIGGRRLIDRVLDAVRPLSDDILIVGDLVPTSPYPSVRLIPDAVPHHSLLMSVYTGLLAARHELAVVVGCHMPFLSPAALRLVASSARGHDVAAPQSGATWRCCTPPIGAPACPPWRGRWSDRAFGCSTFYWMLISWNLCSADVIAAGNRPVHLNLIGGAEAGHPFTGTLPSLQIGDRVHFMTRMVQYQHQPQMRLLLGTHFLWNVLA